MEPTNVTVTVSNETQCFLSDDFVISTLALCSLIAFCVNAVVVVSVFWIRRPLTPILKMSLGLAAADILSSITMVFPNYIPETLSNWKLILGVTFSIGLIATVAHLLALSLNHYIGIMKPLHYNAIMTSRKVSILIAILWLLPITFILIIYTVISKGKFWQDIFRNKNITHIDYDNTSLILTNETRNNSTLFLEMEFEQCDETEDYIDMFSLRMSFSTLLIVPIILMAFFYIHILIVVRRQQKKWKYLSRSGSRKYRGKMTDQKCTKNLQSEQRQLEGNVKAIYTTFLIMGSCFIGWMPAVMLFSFFCRCDCYVNGELMESWNKMYHCKVLIVRLVENLLVIIKMCINPIIYSMRMKEIREGRTRMYWALMRLFCPSRQNGSSYNLACHRSPNLNSGVSVQVRITSLRTNGVGNGLNNRMTHIMHEPISNTLL